MPQKMQKEKTKTQPTSSRVSRSQKAKIKKAQEQGGLSDIAFTHTSKKKILEALKENDIQESLDRENLN